ncbi:MAG: preprotein translocase subunit YajC [Thermoleophilia bacterium]|nr:preprotein translocase subunit YajC [Thermoleophilia bacterium]
MIASITNLFFIIAQESTDTGGEEAAGGIGSYMLFIYVALFVGVFYFLLIRPGQKQRKQHDQLVSSLSKGDEIMTAGGIYGTITKVMDDHVMVEISDKTEIKLSRNSIARTVKAAGEEVAAAEE